MSREIAEPVYALIWSEYEEWWVVGVGAMADCKAEAERLRQGKKKKQLAHPWYQSRLGVGIEIPAGRKGGTYTVEPITILPTNEPT